MNIKSYHSGVREEELQKWCETAMLVKKDERFGIQQLKLIRTPVEVGGKIAVSSYDPTVILNLFKKLC